MGLAVSLFPLAGEFRDLYEFEVKPALEKYGYQSVRAEDLKDSHAYLNRVVHLLAKADVVIADVSDANGNILYELGIADAFGRIVITISNRLGTVPSDLRTSRLVVYQNGPELRQQLRGVLDDIRHSRDMDLPVIRSLAAAGLVPQSEVRHLEAKVRALECELAVRTSESGSPPDPNLTPAAAAVLKGVNEHLDRLLHEMVSASASDLAEAQAEIRRLLSENAVLQASQGELRKLQQMMVVNPHWKGRNYPVDPDLCFVLMPFGEPWSDDIWKIIEKIATRVGFRCMRADRYDGRVVMDDIWSAICQSSVIVADLTGRNPNVTYEVGLADVLGKHAILLSQSPSTPFDFLGLRLILYDNSIAGVRRLTDELEERLRNARDRQAFPSA